MSRRSGSFLAATWSRLKNGAPESLRAASAPLSLYAALMRKSLDAQLQYPADFALGFVVAALCSAGEILTFGVILTRFRGIGGWDLWSVAFLYGLCIGAYALHRVGAGDLHSTSEYVRGGGFDQLLLRPYPPLLGLICRSGRVGQLANLAVPLATLAVSCERLRAAGVLSAWGLALGVPLCLVSATVLQYAVAVATEAAAFWIVRAQELEVLTIHAPNTAGEYPLSVYPAWLRGYLLGVVPVGLCVFLPARELLGRGGGWVALAVAPAAAAAALAVALWVWRAGERRYQGTGT